MNFNLGTTIN